MKTCSLCKTQMPDEAEFCIFCGNKIKSLEELIQEKRNEISSSSEAPENEQTIENQGLNSDDIDEDTKNFRKNRNILIALIILLIGCIFLVSFSKDKALEEKKEYEAIQNQLSVNDYEGAYESINKFIEEHEKSEYVDDLIRVKNEIKPQVDLIQNQKEYMSAVNEIGEKISMSGEMVIEFSNALEALDMNKDNVQFTYVTKDTEGKDLYEFVYNAHNFSVSYDDNNKLQDISDVSGEKLYENGQVIKPVTYFVIPYDEVVNLSKITKMIVNLVHNYPTLTKFPSIKSEQYAWDMKNEDNVITINSYLTYRNENAIFVKDNFKVILIKENNSYKLLDIYINGNKMENLVY